MCMFFSLKRVVFSFTNNQHLYLHEEKELAILCHYVATKSYTLGLQIKEALFQIRLVLKIFYYLMKGEC